ncbi:MAG: AsmA family protein [Alphaproteobacteria bacterium]|nr:AsmA family protein [Alphaproteobacteria bacterium]
MKKLLYAFVAIIGLILIVPNFIDWSHFKEPLIEAVKTNAGYDLDIKGSVNLSLFPTPHLKAHDIFVKNKPGGKSESLLELKSVSLSLNIMPLLQGKIVVDKIELIEPIVHLETSETEKNNWEIQEKIQIRASPSSQGPIIKHEEGEPAHSANIALRKIIIRNGQVSVSNLKNKTHHEVKNINLEGGFDSLSGPFNVKGQVDFNEFTIKGDIQTGELFNKNPASIKANINLSKNKDDYGTLRVEGTMEDKRFVGDLTSDALKLPFSLDLVNKKIDLQKGLTLKAHLDAQPEDIKISELKAFLEDIKLEGELAYKISNITGQLLLSEGPAQIKLLVQGLSDDKNLWNGHITIHSDKPQAFLKWVGADDKGPYLQGEIDIGTSLSVQDSSYVFKGLKFKVGQFDGTGDVTVKLGESRPYIRGELSLGKLDFNAILPSEKTEKAEKTENENPAFPVSSSDKTPSQPAKSETNHWSKEKWNLEVLKSVNADFKVSIRDFCYDEYQLSQVSMTFHLKDGNLQITSFGAQGYGGNFNGDISLQSDSALKLNFGIQKLDLASLPKVRKTPLKKATLTTSLHLNAKGGNAYDVIYSLAGEMNFNLTQGVVETFDIKKFVNDIKQVKAPGDVNAVISDLNSTAQTPFDYLKANFKVQNGKASSQDIEFSSPDITLTGKGAIDLMKWLIDMQVQVKVKELTKLPSLGLAIEGSLDSPSYKVDQAQLAKVLLQEFANRAIDNAVQGIGGKVGDLLKGVLGKKQETPALKPDSSEQPLQPVQQQAPQENSIKPEKIIKDLLKAF